MQCMAAGIQFKCPPVYSNQTIPSRALCMPKDYGARHELCSMLAGMEYNPPERPLSRRCVCPAAMPAGIEPILCRPA